MKHSLSFVSPEYFDSGAIGRMTATNDEYFVQEMEPAVKVVLDEFVSLLPEWSRSAVQMCVMSGMTYEEAAEHISVLRNKKTHKKTVWRWARKGVEELREWLVMAPWVSTMTSGKIPVDELDENEPIYLPWSDDGEV